MNRLIAFCAVLLASGPLAAQTYKWVDEHGVTNYGEKPPAGRAAQPVDTRPEGTLESGDIQQKKYEDAMRRQAQPPPPPPYASRPAAAPASTHGMDFATYIRLENGMTEGELILRAGRPDYQTTDNLFHDIVKSFYYYPTLSNPYITVVTLRGGRIVNIERTRKTY